MEERTCAGYKIVRSLRIDDAHEIVIGKAPNAPAQYVCWYCSNGNSYDTGAYCQTFRQALLVLAERIQKGYFTLPLDAE